MMQPPAGPGDLPAVARLFPLTGAILLPRSVLPLNIFEPRYLAMVRDAMASDQLIAMAQPRADRDPPPLYEVAGLGRITRFSETGDGRLLIAVTGLTRIRLVDELAVTTPYRQFAFDAATFSPDWSPADSLSATTRASLEAVLRTYLEAQGLSADWEAVKSADDESLVNTLATVCPFDPPERQALLEAPGLSARADILTALMQFAPNPGSGGMLQ